MHPWFFLPFFDKKIQLDLNCLWISALLSAEKILPNKNYLQIAENFYDNLERLFLNENNLFHTNSKTSVFLEDYAYAIAMLLDLSDQTLKPNYLLKAKELCESETAKRNAIVAFNYWKIKKHT